MNFLKTLGSFVGGGGAGGLPYSIDEPSSTTGGSSSGSGAPGSSSGASGSGVASSGPLSPRNSWGEYPYPLPEFLLFTGKSKADASHQVTIFKSKQPASQLTQNALKRIKTLRHPNILSFVDGIEVPNNGPVFIVTEPVMPLTSYLEQLKLQYGSQSEEFQMSVSWGLRSVLLALKFVNMDCKLVHGRLTPQSIFVTRGGDWKLAGFEMTTELTADGPGYLFTSFEQFLDASFKPPECLRRDWKALGNGNAPPCALDMWSFGCLLYYMFNDFQVRSSDLTNATNIPHAIRTHFRKCIEADPRRRVSPDKFLASNYFDTPFIKRMDALENLAIKSPEEKVEFYKELCANLHTLPQCFGIHKVLPTLKSVVEFGAASSARNGPVKLDPSASHMLPAMVQIGSQLTPEEFKQQVLPILVKLFSCNDRAVRVQLLQMMEKFAVHFDANLVNSSVVFDNICSGFTDTSPVLRELTVKSMLHFADKLSDSNLNTRVMKHFAKLQMDPEPAIRTNTTICLGRIAAKLNESTRSKALYPAFARALKDPFPHARIAGLRSLTACETYFSAQAMAANILPIICPLLLDVSVSVREQATLSFDIFMKKVVEEAAEMKIREERHAQEEKLKQQNAPAGLGSQQSQATSAQPNSASGGYASSITSWATSVVSTNVNRLVNSGETSVSTPSNATQPTAAPTPSPSLSVASAGPSHSSFGSSGMSLSGNKQPGGWGADDLSLDAEDDDLAEDAWGAAGTDDLGLSSVPHIGGLSVSKPNVRATPAVGLNVSGFSSTSTSSAASASASASAAASGSGWGKNDGWGDDDDLDSNEPSSKPATAASSISSTRSVGASHVSLGTSSFGASCTAAASHVSLGSSSTSSMAASHVSLGQVGGLESKSSTKPRLNAMKLESKNKKGDEWDEWDF